MLGVPPPLSSVVGGCVDNLKVILSEDFKSLVSARDVAMQDGSVLGRDEALCINHRTVRLDNTQSY